MATRFGYDSQLLDAIRMFHAAANDLPAHQLQRASLTTDAARTDLLQHVLSARRISLRGWDYDEICAFLLFTYPVRLFRECCRSAGGAKFVDVLYDAWRPSFELYAFAMWEYLGRDSVLFGHWLYLLRKEQRASKQQMGKVLFSTMVKCNMLSESDCASVTGALLPYPLECMYAREHEQQIDKYSMLLEPDEVGLICRSLFLHRAIERSSCGCDFRERKSDLVRCTCVHDSAQRNNQHAIKLSNDLDKEYATVIFNLILERHHQESVAYDRRWSKQKRDQFLRSACEHVFCKEVYTEIYQNLHSGRKPSVPQRYPRPLSGGEISSNVTRAADCDYNPSLANHNGCVVRSCSQSTKKGCANVSCRTHCHALGYHTCNAHRFYAPHEEPHYLPRRGVDHIPEHMHSGERGLPAKREGNI